MEDNIPMNKRTPCEWQVSEAIQTSLDQMIANEPLKYKMAQDFGDFLMDTPFANVDRFKISEDDVRGEKLRLNNILNSIKYYGMTMEDLSDDEKKLLVKMLGNNWNEIFNVQENAN